MALQRLLNTAIGFNPYSPRLKKSVLDRRRSGPIRRTGIIGGGFACPGCGENKAIDLAIKSVKALGRIPILVISTGCTEVVNMASTPPPLEVIERLGSLKPEELTEKQKELTRWAGTNKFDCPTIHLNFESAAATASGEVLALKTLIEDGYLPPDLFVFLVWGGDGAIEDIGLGAVLGAGDRKVNIVVLEGMNGWYGNTGFQVVIARSYKGARLAYGAWGKLAKGKEYGEKDIFETLLANGYEYVAFASPIFPADLIAKVQKAALIDAPTYVGFSCYCPQGSDTPGYDFFRIPRLQLDTRLFHLMEAEVIPEKGLTLYTLNYAPASFVPVKEFFAPQKPFRQLVADKGLLAEHQRHVDNKWRFWNPVFAANDISPIAAEEKVEA